MVEISTPTNYELLIRAEEFFDVPSEQREIPTLIIGDRVLVGENPIREHLIALIEQGSAQGRVDWPDIPGLKEVDSAGSSEGTLPNLGMGEPCSVMML